MPQTPRWPAHQATIYAYQHGSPHRSPGNPGGYLAAIGFFGTNQLDQLSELGSVPAAELMWILAGMPLIAVVVRRSSPGNCGALGWAPVWADR